MSNSGREAAYFLTGLGIGAVLAILFAPKSGEQAREWIADTAEREFKMLRRKGSRSVKLLQTALAKGEEKVTEVLRSGRDALESLAPRLD
jgi:gas vesicle protein